MAKKTDDKASYRDLKAELDEIIFNLQREDLGIDEAVELYETGQKLVKQLEAYLNGAENKISKLKTKFE